ncbi:MAG: cytidylate kinase family protein [Candidatus Nanoarchaeia archaeon]|jgi:cytidylate kinase
MNIIISGSAGTGKSTVSREVAKVFGLHHVSAGEQFRAVAQSMGYATTGKDYLRFHEYQRGHPEIDEQIDCSIKAELDKGDCVLDTRIAAYLYKGKAYRVLLKVPDSEAAKRNALRENIVVSEALKAVIERNKADSARYKKIYGIDLNDHSVYDLVIDTSYFSIKEMNDIVLCVLKKLI